jgi:putative DNA primase/helicase
VGAAQALPAAPAKEAEEEVDVHLGRESIWAPAPSVCREVEYMQSNTLEERCLADHHLEALITGSGISEEVIRSRGYWTCTDPEDLVDLGFNKRQRRTPCLVIPVRGVNREILFHRIRPDDPRPDAKKAGKVIKYDQPAGVPVALDIPPLAHEDLLDRTRMLWIVEGEKKADTLVSRGECAVALLGVWNWKKDGQMLLDWEEIPLMGREILIAFDSDAVANYQVRLAEDALAKALEGRMGYVG